jgi:hypothetical protein
MVVVFLISVKQEYGTMGAFRAAMNALAALNISGIRNNYGIDTVPDDLSRAQLPALLVLPLTQKDRLFPEQGRGFEAMAFSGGMKTVTYSVTHLLLAAPLTGGSGFKSNLPLLVDLIDVYFEALGANVLLNGTLLEPPQVRVEPGVFRHGTTEYFGCAFRHLWVLDSSV